MKKRIIFIPLIAVCLVWITHILTGYTAFLYDEYILTKQICTILFAVIGVASLTVYFLVSKWTKGGMVFSSIVIVTAAATLWVTHMVVYKRHNMWGITATMHFLAHQVPFLVFMIATNIDLSHRIIRKIIVKDTL